MWLQMDLDGIIVKLQIQQYQNETERAYDEYGCWCEVSYSFSSEPWLNYKGTNDEVFLSLEVDGLAQALDDLISDRLTEPVNVVFVEPDFCFKMSPKKELSVENGTHEIIDISIDWQVYFWHDGLTANHLTIAMDREDIIHLRNYLYLIIGKYHESTPEIVEMKEKGILY